MALRSSGRKLSFEILTKSNSLEEDQLLLLSQSSPDTARSSPTNNIPKKKRRRNKHKKSSPHADSYSTIAEDPSAAGSSLAGSNRYGGGGSVVCTTPTITVVEYNGGNSYVELRQRNVVSRVIGETTVERELEVVSDDKPRNEPPPMPNGGCLPRLETAESLDWKRLMAEDPTYLFSVEKSPLNYFMDEIDEGNSLRRTTTLGSEKERERVYDTLFRLPWRCELLIDVGFFVCLDSFLSLLTVMPTRVLMTLWRLLKRRQFQKLSAADWSDFGCFIVLASGVLLLDRTDISLIYHMIRGQGTIKLYVVYNVLEIFDKLCQSFGGDVFQTLFNSAEGLASCPPETKRFWIWRFLADQVLAMAFSILHSFLLLAQAITLSTCIVAHNNALLALLVSNNFSEIKSNVFKRFSKENIHNIVYADSVERFHITAFLLFVLAQNILEAEGPWFESFVYNALLVFVCEMLIDIIKHSFLAKFNDIKPIAYSEFLEELCNQTLNIQSGDKKKILTFIPLAPACVVSRDRSFPSYYVYN
ncbi:unnamed protein product [Linum tenue]|uniref:Protein POLLEN DEFECTIVE IN GUIDANCE 1 n=1 Tax=Linum tenue TaxID=586396 RepID=A0AAV0N623_9ROSI|nr:unnamed protein product [Linum tenue]